MLKKIKNEINTLLKLKNTKIKYHTPILASTCMFICLMTGLYLNNITAGLTASMSALIVVYFPVISPMSKRIITLLACSFMFVLSYAIGLIFSFNHTISAVALGLFTFFVHWSSSYLKLPPPKSFFFIMIAATASGIPYNLNKIPERIGLLALGAISTSIIAFLYSFFVNKKSFTNIDDKICIILEKDKYTDVLESIIIGIFMFICLEIGFLLKITNPYWIPVSCAAVMQGANTYHVWQRVAQRILGTFIGLGLCWIILKGAKEMWILCLLIVVLQFILEIFIPINYAIAVMFITPLTILLAEASDSIINNANLFITIRLYNTIIGSLIGIIGGWLIHHEKLHYK